MSSAERGHNWSGWPGAWCQKCGAEDTIENAMGLGWFSLYPDENNNAVEWWLSDKHKEYVLYVQNNCQADMTPEEIEIYRQKIKELSRGI